MIAFEELVSALDRWRTRNGLPVVTGDLPMSSAPPRSAAPAPAYAAPTPTPAPRAAAPEAAAIGDSSDVLSLGDADVLEDEELYSNDGDDFAMSFGVNGGNPVGSVSGSIGSGRGSSATGASPAVAPPAMPSYEGQPSYDAASYATPEDEYDPDAYPATPPPPPAAAVYAATPGSGPYAQAPGMPELYDDPAYDPPGGDPHDRPATDGDAPPGPDTLEVEDEIIDESTVVGDDHRAR